MRIRKWMSSILVIAMCLGTCSVAGAAEGSDFQTLNKKTTKEENAKEMSIEEETATQEPIEDEVNNQKKIEDMEEAKVNSQESSVDEEVEEGSETGKWVEEEEGWRYQKADGSYYMGIIAEIDGEHYSFDENGFREIGWKLLDEGWFYFNAFGVRITGWEYIKGKWYYLQDTGVMATGWQYIDQKWYYLETSGAMAVGWKGIQGQWYYLRSSGSMAIGWEYVNGKWYYLRDNGGMATGWQYVDSKWYYLQSSGAMTKGWQRVSGKWYYLLHSGVMTTGWQRVSEKWYYMRDSGALTTGWQYVDNKWYYMENSGAMAVGWRMLGGKWYYLNSSGAMVTGWQYISGYKHLFNSSGVMSEDLRNVVSGPYSIKVNRQQNCITIYARDGYNGYIIPVKSFLCSTGGYKTPLGTFTMSTQYRWHQLFGAQGQYCSRIVGNVLFHSVPYYRSWDVYSLMPGQFNRLGTNASAGCVRLATGDAKWIYDNCRTGQTKITIYDSSSASPLGKPILPKIPYYQNWDPTDPAIF